MPFHRNIASTPLIAVCSLLIIALLTSCAPSTPSVVYPTYDPFLPIVQGTLVPANDPVVVLTSSPTATREPTPTRAPLSVAIPTLLSANQPITTPTPDAGRVLPTPRQDADQYMVQVGDTLGLIAERYGISLKTLMEANNIADANLLEVGMLLNVPAPNPEGEGTAFKVIPDSELVNGPAAVNFDIKNFIDTQNGYLETYTQDVDGTVLSGDEIVSLVAQNYSVNPRLLLALLEYQSGWVTNPEPFNTAYPMGLADEYHYGLYRQLTWAADTLNQGYYLWRANAISTWVLNDSTVVPVDPTINAGTAALQYFFSQLDDRPTWEQDVSGTGLLLTYFVFFGNPFDLAIEPLVPTSVTQPPMNLPFNEGEAWYFTGGPHGGWASGSGWAAIDFVADAVNIGCQPSDHWVTAMSDGTVIRSQNGGVVVDLDNDGIEQTGWTILYMHIAADGRVAEGTRVKTGDRIGHPSCEGGAANATHVHLARRYNGEWIPAGGTIPFVLDGWQVSGEATEYDGRLAKGADVKVACECREEKNSVTK